MAAYGHQIVGRPANWFNRRNDRSWRPRDLVRLQAPEGGERALPPMGEARSRDPRAWPLANRLRPGAPSNRHRRRCALAACAAVCAAVIATVMASRDVTA